MTDRAFVDSNLWVYLYDDREKLKQRKIEKLISNNFDDIIISSQVLNEMYNVLDKKIKLENQKIKEIIIETITNFKVAEIGVLDVIKAMDIREKYGYSYWDRLVISSAIENNCEILYSEDMQNGQIIENKLKIVNPFF